MRGLVVALLPVPLLAAALSIATLVARRGRVVHVEAHGLADLDTARPMQTGALFRMASMTKPLTAVSILMLMEEGTLLRRSRHERRNSPRFRPTSLADRAASGT